MNRTILFATIIILAVISLGVRDANDAPAAASALAQPCRSECGVLPTTFASAQQRTHSERIERRPANTRSASRRQPPRC